MSTTPMLVALVLVILAYPDGSDACGLGFTMSRLTVRNPGDYRVSCNAKPYPICPEYCYWTNRTCEEYAKRHSWPADTHVLTNFTYWYPVREKVHRRMKGDSAQKKESLPRKKSAVATMTTLAPKTKSVQRKCCVTRLIHTRQCKTIDWAPNMTNGNFFDVNDYGKKWMNCTKGAHPVIKDIRVKNMQKSEFSIDVCCLNLTGQAASTVACARWEHGGEEAAIAAAIALPLALALGIGIPLLFRCREDLFIPHSVSDGQVYQCLGTQTSKFVNRNRCCAICSAAKGAQVCLWGMGKAARDGFPGSDGRPTCSLCPTSQVSPNPGLPVDGLVGWFPKNA